MFSSCSLLFVVCVQANTTTFYVVDAQFRTGAVGFLSAGVGWIDDSTLRTLCDSGTGCFNAQDGMRCSYSCAAGYIFVSGDTERVCTSGAWTGSDLVCSILPPMFLDQAVSVYEVWSEYDIASLCLVSFYCFVTKTCARRPGAAASMERRRRERRTLLVVRGRRASRSDMCAASQAFERMHILWVWYRSVTPLCHFSSVAVTSAHAQHNGP